MVILIVKEVIIVAESILRDNDTFGRKSVSVCRNSSVNQMNCFMTICSDHIIILM
ncbi:MAG: hypothetical protein ACOYJX_08140 [Acutalibacteraceae bacterium]